MNVTIGSKLSLSQKQLFAVKSVEEQKYIGFDDDNGFFLTDNLDKAELFDGQELIVELEDLIIEVENDIEGSFTVEYIGYENVVGGFGLDC